MTPLQKDQLRRTMSFNGLNMHSGNSMVDSLLAMLLNPMGMMSSPGRGQSILDAQNIRFRSRDQLELMRHGLGTSVLGQHLGGVGGVDMNGVLGTFATPILGMSNILDNPFLQSANGGNPVKAIMGLKANATGMTMGMGFGRITDADNFAVKAAFKEFQNTLFRTRTITGNDMNDLMNRVGYDTAGGLSQASRGILGGFLRKGADGRDFFDFGAYQAAGSGRELLRSSIADRKMALSSALRGADLSGTGLNINDIDQSAFDELKKKTKGFTEKISKTMTDAALEALKKADEKTSVVKAQQDKLLRAIDEVSSGDSTISQFRGQIGERVTTGVNSRYMRGYSLDQLTKAYTMSLDLGLSSLSWADRTGKMTEAQKMSKSASGFARNAGGALRAVSDLTGAEDATGALEDLNSLLGNSLGNLGTEQGANQIENLVRRFKASARTAGVGIEAVMTILNEVKALSAAHPQLQYSGGIGAMETSIKSLNITGSLAATMGSDWVRKMGGSAELSRQITETLVRNKTEPVVSKSKGLAGYIASSNLSAEAKKRALDIIEQFDSGSLNGKTHNFNNTAWGQLYESLGGITGESGSQLHRAALSHASQLAGQIYADANPGRDFDQGAINATGGAFFTAVGLALNSDGQRVAGADGRILTPEQRKQALIADLNRRGETGEHISTILSRYKLNGNGRLNRYIKDSHFMANLSMYIAQQQPGYKQQYTLSKKITDIYAEQEAEIGRQFSHLNQPFNQTLIQGFLNGDFGDGKQTLLDAISDDPARMRVKSMLDSVQNNQHNKTSASFRAAILETLGGAEGLTDEAITKNLYLQGQNANVAAVLAKRKALTAEGMDHFLGIAGSLSIGQLFGTTAGNYKGSAAAGMGIALSDIEKASSFARNTGIIDDSIIKTHSNHMFGDLLAVLPMKRALLQAAQVTYQDARGNAVGLAADKLQANMQGLSDMQYSSSASASDKAAARKRLGDELQLYHAAGYLKLKNSKLGVVLGNIDWEASKTGIGQFLEDISSTQLSEGLRGKLGGLSDPSQLSKDEQEELLKYGGAVRGLDGKVRIDSEGLRKLKQKQSAISAAQSSPSGVLKKYSELLSRAASKRDEDLGTAQSKLDASVLEDIGRAFSNGSKDIVSALSRVVEALKSAL